MNIAEKKKIAEQFIKQNKDSIKLNSREELITGGCIYRAELSDGKKLYVSLFGKEDIFYEAFFSLSKLNSAGSCVRNISNAVGSFKEIMKMMKMMNKELKG